MTSPLRWSLYLLGLLITTGLIWKWNRGAQRRRFRKAYPLPHSAWTPEETDFLRCFERAFRLPKGWGTHLSPELTPMDVYLTLYPEHCIYDTGETTRLLSALRTTETSRPEDLLNLPLRELAHRYHHATRS